MEKIEGLDVHQFIFTDLPNGSGSYQADKNLYPYVKIDGEYCVNDGTSFTYNTSAALLMPITYGYQVENETWNGLSLFEHDGSYFDSRDRINYSSRINNGIFAVKLNASSNDDGYKINYHSDKEHVWVYSNSSNKNNKRDLYNFKDGKLYGFGGSFTNLAKFGTDNSGAVIPFWTNEETGYTIDVQIKGNKLTAKSNNETKTMYLPYGSKVLLFLREGGDMKLTKTLPVRTGRIAYNSFDSYANGYSDGVYNQCKILNPQILLVSQWNYGGTVITNLSTRSVSSISGEGIRGLGSRPFAEIEISGIKMYTTRITINKDTNVSFTLDRTFIHLVKLPWHQALYNNNLIQSNNNVEYQYKLNAADSEMTIFDGLLLNEEKDNYQIQNYFNIKYTSLPSINIFETKDLTSTSSSYDPIIGTVPDTYGNYNVYAKFDLKISQPLYGIASGKNFILIDAEAIKPYTFKLNNVQYTAQTSTKSLADIEGPLAAFSANLKVNSPGSYASWIAIAPPEWEETIEGKLLNIDQSTVFLGDLWFDQDQDEFGNIYTPLMGTIKNTNNFDVYATIYCKADNDEEVNFSEILKANTEETFAVIVPHEPANVIKEISATYQALGYNTLTTYSDPATVILDESHLYTVFVLRSSKLTATIRNDYDFPIKAKIYYYTTKPNFPLFKTFDVPANSRKSYSLGGIVDKSVTLKNVIYYATDSNYIDVTYNDTVTNNNDIVEVQ